MNAQFGHIRHDWSRQEVLDLLAMPFNDLMFQAQLVHRQHFDPNQVQLSTLLSIKTGSCPEDCKYCPQSASYDTGLEKEKLLDLETVVEEAKRAKASGASRFCMGAAWRVPRRKEMPKVLEMVREVKAMGLETCMTLGTRRRISRMPGWTTTTTIWTPRRSITAKLLPPGPMRTDCKPWITCAGRA